MSSKTFAPCILAVALAFPVPASANKIQKLDISPYDGYSDAPLVEVYSTNGENWNAVDQSKPVHFKVKLKAELTKRLSENTNQNRYQILGKGSTVNYAGAFSVKYRMYCHATGLGKSDYGSDTTLVNARIHCAASELAKAKIPKPPPRAKVKPARLSPLVKSASFKANPETWQGTCPVGVKFNGSITASRAGKVKYQYTSHDGKKSPEFTIEFKAAGSKPTRTWNRTLSQPDSGSQIAAATGGSNWDYQGWYRLDILEPKSAEKAKAGYKVSCQAPKPTRAVKP